MGERFDETKRRYLAGCILLDISVRVDKGTSRFSMTPTATFYYISNPSYFGPVKVEIKGGGIHSNVTFVERAKGYSTGELIGKTIAEIDLSTGAMVEEIQIERKINTLQLEKVENYNPKIDTIIASAKEIVLFRGESNWNYVCSNCGMILAERTWRFSLRDILIKCPTCSSILKVPPVSEVIHNYPDIRYVGIEAGEYNFSDSVKLKPGVSLFGRVEIISEKK